MAGCSCWTAWKTSNDDHTVPNQIERDFERLSMKVEAWIDEAEVLSAAASPLAEHAS